MAAFPALSNPATSFAAFATTAATSKPERKNIDIGDYYSNFDLISSDLGWQPKVGLKLGLENSLKYYRKNCKHYWADTE